jgi:hypothetical protein
MFLTILGAIDGSKHGGPVLQEAIDLAAAVDATGTAPQRRRAAPASGC